LWVHLDVEDHRAQEFLRNRCGIDVLVQDALLAEETRPRSYVMGEGLLAIFRGVNLNSGADPEDMVSVRVRVESTRLISTRPRPLMAVRDLQQRMAAGRDPETIGDLLTELAERMSGIIQGLDDEADRLETLVVDAPSREVRSELAAVSRQPISLRRYVAPQREALGRLLSEELRWLDSRCRARLREVTDRLIRYVEDLDLVRERAAVIQDELMNRQSEQMNRNTYLLAIVAAVMLPLGFITGLLGVNVDGIPGTSNSPWAFTVVTVLLVLVAALEVLLLRRLRLALGNL
jgi:zinc transporter